MARTSGAAPRLRVSADVGPGMKTARQTTTVAARASAHPPGSEDFRPIQSPYCPAEYLYEARPEAAVPAPCWPR